MTSGAGSTARRAGGRQLVAVGMVLVAVLALSACQDWTQFMGGAAHTGDDSAETVINSTNAASLSLAFTDPGVAQPVTRPGVTVVSERVYAATDAGLVVTSYGSTHCSTAPIVCQPLWTAPTAPFGAAGGVGQPAVANGVVYMTSGGIGGGDLRAFDANGVTDCSGSPTVCQPLWTANAPSDSGAVVDGSSVVVSTGSAVEAFDANGVTNCSGSPKVCQPLWTAASRDNWIPTVADGRVYVATGAAPYELQAFDEAGSTGCSGTPVVCGPEFTASLPGATPGSVTVSGGVAYALTGAGLVAVDAAGSTGCTGVPVVCQPTWSAPSATSSVAGSTPAVADGHLFVVSGSGVPVIAAFDAAGLADCSGTPVVCVGLGAAPSVQVTGVSPLVSDGVVWVGGQAWSETALTTSCSSGAPCQPIADVATASGPAAISMGKLLLNVAGSTGTTVEAFGT